MTTQPATQPQPLAEHLIRQLYGLGHVRRELAKASTQAATPCFGALASLYRLGPSRVSAVANALQVDLSVASRQVAHLVEVGHVDRLKDPDDGRAHLLQLTDAGLEALGAAHREMVAVLAEALGDWQPEEVAALSAGLERLAHSFDPSRTTQEIAR
ncbi:MAG: MarR family transcriptional regulator [Solirubrobacteraceae bacterium]|nr:MarR family transcriptional regulator [Patulibacter sp.]